MAPVGCLADVTVTCQLLDVMVHSQTEYSVSLSTHNAGQPKVGRV